MIRFITKKEKQKELKKAKFLPANSIVHETEIAARDLQSKIDEKQRLENATTGLASVGSMLKAQNVGLKIESQELNKSILKKRGELSTLDTLIGSRNSNLAKINEILLKISQQYGIEAAKLLKQIEKIKEVETKYQEAATQYAELTQKISVLVKQKKQEEKEIVSAKTEKKKAKEEAQKHRSHIEESTAKQTGALKMMRFYAQRINRYYEDMQMKPPIDLSM